MDDAKRPCGRCVYDVNWFSRSRRLLERQVISFEEFASNAMLHGTQMCEGCLGRALAALDDPLAQAFAVYLEEKLVPEDFRPWPGAFIADFHVPGIVDRTKEVMRPAYLRLHRLAQARMGRAC